MSDSIDDDVLAFVRKELSAHNLGMDDSITSGNAATVHEDVMEMVYNYSKRFNVDCSEIEWLKYFPNTGIPFLPNFILPKKLKTDHTPPAPLTVRMLSESAKAGRWLYD